MQTTALAAITVSLMLTLVAFGASEGTIAQDPAVSAALAQLDAQLAAVMKERNLPGISAGVIYDRELIWAKGYGYAALQRHIPADADSIYEIGSVTKLFNAVMLMKLRDAGKLSLDDPIEKYLPEFKIKSGSKDFDGQVITFRPATGAEPASIELLGVKFPRTGDAQQ